MVQYIITLFINFNISSIFLDSFEFVNKTIIQCFYIDEEMFVGIQRYSEDYISELIEYYNGQKDPYQKIKA